MTTLPSFVELMSSLGLDQRTPPPPAGSPHSSSPPSPSVPPSLTESRSSPSLRDTGLSRNRLARYSPYSPVFLSRRRGSLSSLSSSSSDYERPSPRAYSTSPRPSSPLLRRRANRNLTVNVYGSTTDLSANTPISIYVRRKTPGASPTSSTFSREDLGSPMASPMPFTLPTLPLLFPQSANSDNFPLTPTSDAEASSETNSPNHKPLPDVSDTGAFMPRSRYRTGIRISTPPRSADLSGRHSQHRIVAPIA